MKKICIVGGGSAGLITALILKNRFSELQIDIIKSDKIGTIGIGEGSTEHFKDFMRFCGITNEEIIKETGATIKYGILFKQWLKHDYVHNVTSSISDIEYGQYKAGYAYAVINKLKPNEYTDQCVFDNKIYNKYIPNQFHFDALKLNNFLIKKCKELNIKIIIDEIVKVNSSNNKITSIETKTKKYIYDFYIDSSGFKKLLISKLGAKWKSYKEYLPINQAIVFQTKDTEKYPLTTISVKLKYGWLFQIPVQGRWGNGYIFDNNYINTEQAKEEVETYLGHPINIGKSIKFDTGCLDKCWVGNCLAIGLSCNFIEPLEATSIGSVIQQSFLLMHLLYNYSEQDISLYNKKYTEIMENMRDFVSLHYYYDDHYKIPESLKILLSKWKNRLPIAEDFSSNSYILFHPHNFIVLLKEYNLFNINNIKKEFDALDPSLKKLVQTKFKDYNNYYKNCTDKISHKEFLKSIYD